MGWIVSILVLAGAIGLGCYCYIDGWCDMADGILGALGGALIGLMASILVIGVIYFGWYLPSETLPVDQPSEIIEIISLKDSYGIEGYIYHRRGEVDSKIEYIYLYNTSKGMKLGEIPADEAYIYETDDEKPCIKVYKYRPKSDFLFEAFGYKEIEYIITIPKDNGIVKNEYVIDLE